MASGESFPVRRVSLPEADHGLLAEEDLQGAVVLDVGDEQLDAVRPDVDRRERPHGGGIFPSVAAEPGEGRVKGA